MPTQITIQLNDATYTVKRAGLRLWLELEDLRDTLKKAAETGDLEAVSSSVFAYISAATLISVEEIKDLPWHEIVTAFSNLGSINYPNLSFPFLTSNGTLDELPWDYHGRTWYEWAHLLAGAYGYSLEYIAKLDIDDALGLAQEIAVEAQLQREWEWALSDKSVHYDEHSKKAHFQELDRPAWMQKTKLDHVGKGYDIPEWMKPVGVAVRWMDGSPQTH